ncbi:MAG: RNA polymerase sigma factor [Sphingobium sp.]
MTAALKQEEAQGRIVSLAAAQQDCPELVRAFRLHEARLVRYLQIRLGSLAEAEDAAQSTFLRLFARGNGLREENVTALLYVTARNLSTDLLRQRKRRREEEADGEGSEVETLADQAPGPERSLSAQQDLRLVLKVVQELPEKCRRSFISFRFHGRSYEELAEQMGVTESMVRKYVRKATAHCARRFEELEGWE